MKGFLVAKKYRSGSDMISHNNPNLIGVAVRVLHTDCETGGNLMEYYYFAHESELIKIRALNDFLLVYGDIPVKANLLKLSENTPPIPVQNQMRFWPREIKDIEINLSIDSNKEYIPLDTFYDSFLRFFDLENALAGKTKDNTKIGIVNKTTNNVSNAKPSYDSEDYQKDRDEWNKGTDEMW